MTFDVILEEVGGFGRFQKFLFALVCYTVFLSGLYMLQPVFLLGIPEHRCAIPDYANDTYEIRNEEHEALVEKFIPTSDKFMYNRCYVCQTNGTHVNSTSPVNCTLDRAVKCSKWVYDKSVYTNTFVSQVDLVCDKEIWVANAEMIFYGGILVGSLASGILADVYGRKPVVCISSVILVVASFGLTLANDYWLFCVTEFIIGGSVVALNMPVWIISVEVTSTQKRMWPGVVTNLPYVVGLLILSAMAYMSKDWVIIQLYSSILSVILISYWWVLPESPRWLLTKGRVTEAEAIVRKIACWNKTEVTEHCHDQITVGDDKSEESSILTLFTTKKQLFQTLVIFFNWTTLSLEYYGLGLNSDNLNGDLYLNFALSGLVEIPAYFLVIFLVDRVGRRKLYCTLTIIGGISCASTIFSIEYEPGGSGLLTNSLSMLGRLCVTAAYAVTYIHSAELFPTVVRNAGLGGASVFGGIGSMSAPYIVALGESFTGTMRQALPLLIIGGVSFLSGAISLLLPETLNKHLTDRHKPAEVNSDLEELT